MYRNCSSYDDIAKIIIEIYLDYNVTSFPISAIDMCRKLGIKLLPYSDLPDQVAEISDDAFYVTPTLKNPPLIVFNDQIDSIGRKRFSIFHELKHFICGELNETEYNEDMANYFARYFMCPIPVLIYKNVDDLATIMSDYELSYEAASNVLRNVNNRRRAYGDKIFDYEKPLIALIEGSDALCL